MESITGRRPLFRVLGRGLAAPDRSGLVLGLAALAAMAALDIILGTPMRAGGLLLLAPFIPAVLGGVLATVVVGVLAVVVGLVSPIWNSGFGEADYWIKAAGLVLGGAFAIVAARARRRARVTSRRFALQDAVGAIADGSLPLAQTLDRVVELIVPVAADICMIDAIREGRIVRAAVRAAGREDAGEVEARIREREPSVPARFVDEERPWMQIPHFRERMDAEDVRRIAHDPDDLAFLQSLGLRSWIVATMSARGRTMGTLTMLTAWSGRTYSADDVRFAQILATRIGLALDNAGLFSDLESVERRLDAVMSMLDEAVVVHDAHGELVYLNDTAARWLGFAGPDEALATPQDELLQRVRVWSESGARLDVGQLASQLRDRHRAWRGMVRIDSDGLAGERWAAVAWGPIDAPDGSTLYAVTKIEDVTELKRSEFAQQLLARTGELLASSIDYRETLQAVVRLAVPEFADWCSVNIPDRDGLVGRVAIAHTDPERMALVENMRERHPIRMEDGGPLADVIRTGSPRLLPDLPPEREGHPDAGGGTLIRGGNIASGMAVPMTAGAKVVGVLVFANERGSRRFNENDLEIGLEIARRAGLAAENARLAGEQAEVAHLLQKGLLPPDLPDLRGFDVATMYRPAGEVNEVGGDFYDAFEIDGGWMVAIGDVMGRGAAAASLTGLARHTIRTAGRLTGNPRLAASVVDESLKRDHELLLCSAVILVLPDTDEGPARIPILVAGHPPPLRLRAGTTDAVGAGGPLLGAPDEHEWELTTVELGVGDQLILYTDGVTEARGKRNRFGERRLRQSVAGAADPRAAVAAVESALDSFVAGEPEDDAAVLAIMRSRASRSGIDRLAPAGARIAADGGDRGMVSAPRKRGSAITRPVARSQSNRQS
jgi:PAS domain S-box-containing protein